MVDLHSMDHPILKLRIYRLSLSQFVKRASDISDPILSLETNVLIIVLFPLILMKPKFIMPPPNPTSKVPKLS